MFIKYYYYFIKLNKNFQKMFYQLNLGIHLFLNQHKQTHNLLNRYQNFRQVYGRHNYYQISIANLMVIRNLVWQYNFRYISYHKNQYNQLYTRNRYLKLCYLNQNMLCNLKATIQYKYHILYHISQLILLLMLYYQKR